MKKEPRGKAGLRFLVVALALSYGGSLFAQVPNTPAGCEFNRAFGLISDSTGNGKRSFKDRLDTDVHRFYSDDGSVWYEAAISEANPKYFKINDNPDFRPIYPFSNGGPRVRLIGECEHWYQVVVNESKMIVKYVLKSDPLFRVTKWEDNILGGAHVRTDFAVNPIRLRPEGEVVGDQPEGLEYVRPIEIRGDWLFVTGASKRRGSGWIRWRDGDEILLTFWITDFEHQRAKNDPK